MPDPVPPLKKPNLKKFPPWVYGVLAVGVVAAVIIMRRQSADTTVPSTDPTYPVGTPDASVGSFQGYDTPQDNSPGAADILDFALAVRDQNLSEADSVRQTYASWREQDLALIMAQMERQDTIGGGLPADPVPNPAPTPKPKAPSNVKKVSNAKGCGNRYPERSEHGCFKRVCKGRGQNRYEWHIYKSGRKVKVRRCR